MTARAFLATVVSWVPGDYITIHWHHRSWRKGIFKGKSCENIDAFFKAAAELEGVDVYFCLASQREGGGKRSRANAKNFRSQFFDFDIDPNDPKKYASAEEALAALLIFCKTFELPKPTFLVLSGGGLHAYWCDDKDHPVDDWQVYADALKTAAIDAGLKIDLTVTADVSRVLRLPGTMNCKYDPPRPVELVEYDGQGVLHDFSVVFKALVERAPAARPEKSLIDVAEAFKHLDPNQKLAEGIKEAPPVPLEPVRAGCGWINHALETGGKDFDQPQWHLTSLISTFMEDGRTVAHKLGEQHPDYSIDSTDEMYDRKVRERAEKNLGWPYCKTISDSGGHPFCKVCPHFAKGKSPLTLGFAAALEEQVDKEMAELGGTRPVALRLPPGFCVNEKDQLCAHVPTSEKKGKVVRGRLVVLITNPIRSPMLQNHNGHLGISFVATADKGREIEIFLPAGNTYRDSGLLKALAEGGIRYEPTPEAKIMVEKFAKSWLDKLQEEDHASVRDPGMGWKYDEKGNRSGFVFGGNLYNSDGTKTALIQTIADDEFRSWYTPKGDKAAWYAAAKLITDRKRPELDLILAVPFAAPLTVFAGAFYGTVMSVYGEPGTSKSTAQQVAAAVWGHPKQTRESLNSTQKSIQGRLGRTKNLPAYWDDVQDEAHQLALFNTMFVTTQGTEGGRLNPDASYKQRLEWQSMVCVCSNASFVEYLARKQKSTTAGMRRVFEYEFNRKVEPGMINPIAASRAFALLEHNYGHVGADYAQILARDHKDIGELVETVTDRFRVAVKGTTDESFWWGLCGILLTGAMLAATRLKVEIDVDAMELFLFKAFLANRRERAKEGTEGGTLANTELAVTGFLNEHVGLGHALYTVKPFEHREIPVSMLSQPNAGKPVYIQVIRDTRTVLISKRAFRNHLEKIEVRPRQVFAGMAQHFNAKEVKQTLGAGTVYARAQEMCLEFVVPAGPGVFDGVISAHGLPKVVPHLVPNTARDADGA